jgi:peptide deformylase
MTLPRLTIRTYGDPCLRKRSLPVEEIGASERMLIEAMLETMYANKGVGLAAPQVGINQQIFVIDIGEGPWAVINPKILKKQGANLLEEGCLSVPGVTVNVKRPVKILVKYLDQHGELMEKYISGLLARVFQHENDHLRGRMIDDHVSWRKKKAFKKKLRTMTMTAKPDQGAL